MLVNPMKKDSSDNTSSHAVARELAYFFTRNGYVRAQNTKRLKEEGPGTYKKGAEVRLVARSEDELELMRDLLDQAGFKAGRPFRKGNQYCQPLYGKQAVDRFLEMVVSASEG